MTHQSQLLLKIAWYVWWQTWLLTICTSQILSEEVKNVPDQYLTVSQLSQYIKRKFDQDPYLEKVYIKGEVSNAARNRVNTTMYFSLKDDQSVIPVVIFQRTVSKLKFKIEEGMSVFITGRVSTYEKRGNYQIIVDDIQPDGIGALYQALEQTRKALEKEGLFQDSFKQPLEKFPKRIAVVTSESGAVIRDIYATIKRRYPIAELILYPTYVQGESAIPSIIKNIKRADETRSFDTIIIGRGGGSIEDLWAFNDEQVVRSIFEAKTPIISSVGHETDTTLADLVADVRAATPTAAAELAVPVLSDLKDQVTEYERFLAYHVKRLINTKADRLKNLQNTYIFKQPQRLYESYIQNVDHLNNQLHQQFKGLVGEQKQRVSLLNQRLSFLKPDKRIEELKGKVDYLEKSAITYMNSVFSKKQTQMDRLIQSLDHLSPLKILGRGYAYTSQGDHIVKSVDELDRSKALTVNLVDGEVETHIIDVHKKDTGEEGTKN